MKKWILMVFLTPMMMVYGQYFSALKCGFNSDAMGFWGDAIENRVFAAGNLAFPGNNGGLPGGLMSWSSDGDCDYNLTTGSGSTSPPFVRFKNQLHLLSVPYIANGVVESYEFLVYDQQEWKPKGMVTDYSYKVYSAYNAGDSVMYIGGYFDTYAGISSRGIIQYDGQSYKGFPPLPLNNDDVCNVGAIEMYKGELYIGGYIGTGYGPNFFKWEEGAWVKPGGKGIVGGSVGVGDFIIYDDLLLVGGNFCRSSECFGNSVVGWDGTNWQPYDAGIRCQSSVFDFEVYRGELYACGWIGMIGEVDTVYHAVVKWNGMRWEPFGDFNLPVVAMTTLNDELYFSGTFWSVNGIPAYHVAKYGPHPPVKDSLAFELYPNPSNGNFTLSGVSLDSIQIEVFNALGQSITLADSYQNGRYVEVVMPPYAAEGIYYFRIRFPKKTITKKVVLKK